jgi:5'-3' exoribonuclease 1
MGIPHLYKWMRNKQYREVLRRSVPSYVSSFSFDFNGILHNVAQVVYAYGEGADPKRRALVDRTDPLMLEAEYHQALGSKLLQVIGQVRPQEILVLAVDGVAPQAKIAQQRQRRYRAASENSGAGGFNSSAISPGTEFMMRVDNFLQRWLILNAKNLPGKVIYSSHMVAGEGEHMVLSLIRKGEISGKGAHVIYGMDADLIMLSLMAPLNRIHLMREDISNVIDIDNLRLSLKDELKLPTSVEDFVVMIFLLGNDFLPHIVSLHNLDEGIESMMFSYKKAGVSLTKGGNSEEWDIDWKNFAKFLEVLAGDENRLLQMESVRDVKHPSRMMNIATNKSSNIGMNKTDVNVGRTSDFDPALFRAAWYDNAFQLKTKKDVFAKLLPGANFGSSNGKMVEMIKEYLIGIAWVFRYYALGMEFVNNDYVYRNHYAPLISDIAFVAGKVKVEPESYYFNPNALEINPVHQLLAIIPLQAKDLLPLEVLHLARSDSIIADYFPLRIEIERDGMNTDWQGTVLVNFVDMSRIVDAVNRTSVFTQSRIDAFSPVNNIVLIKETEVVDMTNKNQKFRDFLKKETGGRGRGRGRGGFSEGGRGGFSEGGRGGFSEGGRGGFSEGGRGNKIEGGYVNREKDTGYRSSRDDSGRGRGGNYQGGRGRGNYQGEGRGRGNYAGGRGTGRGRGNREYGSSARGYNKPSSPPTQIPTPTVLPAKTYKPLPVQRFEI